MKLIQTLSVLLIATPFIFRGIFGPFILTFFGVVIGLWSILELRLIKAGTYLLSKILFGGVAVLATLVTVQYLKNDMGNASELYYFLTPLITLYLALVLELNIKSKNAQPAGGPYRDNARR
ncbi:hypothetical protein [Pontiella agarivorans]|uniref:Uncharacterized protein n=1 Tax=Pontiella agarivorans TaxID=3038953 RepID=A0ABU5MZD2_9BACT|nr:hypothetical protein [Pontiella agarivorans]MDZ8119533.1 hypothetical protein [Pontiella agarivorans]